MPKRPDQNSRDLETLPKPKGDLGTLEKPKVERPPMYEVLLHKRAEQTLRELWGDVSAAVTGCVAVAAVGIPVTVALDQAGAAPLVIRARTAVLWRRSSPPSSGGSPDDPATGW